MVALKVFTLIRLHQQLLFFFIFKFQHSHLLTFVYFPYECDKRVNNWHIILTQVHTFLQITL